MIREYKKDEVNTILSIWLNASYIAHNFISRTYWESKADDMRNLYIPNADTFVYEDELSGNIWGFISLKENYLAALFVDPSQQAKGIGKQLINHAKQFNDALELNVYKENRKAVDFYLSQNFRIISEQSDIQTGHEEYTMQYQKK